MRAWLRSPYVWILIAAAVMRLAGICWGLPASDGWDNDGFAPRNFLTALALTYAPGSYFTYPPLHAFVLAILTMPGWIMALLHAPSFAQADIVREFIKVPTMTFFAIVARLVSLGMSLGIILCAGRMAELVAGRRAGLCAAAACALGVALTYYSQVSNLDVPYLFWSMIALLCFMRAIAGHAPRRFAAGAFCAAAAIATKDQAYAVFALSVPAILLLWLWAEAWPRDHARKLAVTLLFWGGAAILALLLVDGAITNPGGFARRLAFLTGPASQNYIAYPHNLAGGWDLLKDVWAYFTRGGGFLACLLAVTGLVLHVRKTGSRAAWVAGLLPVFAILSFTLCFDFAALRTDDRFLLPQAVLASVYIGIAADRIAFAQAWRGVLGRLALTGIALLAFYQCAAVDAAFLRDPRYDAERWMAAHVRAGDRLETYGQNAFLPRFPAAARVTRVGPGPLKQRNPQPGITEQVAAYDAAAHRQPRFIVVSAWWARHYMTPQSELGGNRIASPMQQAQFNDLAARRYFQQLYVGALPYRLAHVSVPAAGFWLPVHIHASLNETIWIFERVSPVAR